LALADLVVTASTFAKDSVAGAPGLKAPVRVIPYGTLPISLNQSRVPASGKLRVLFVGLLSQSKGLGYLLEAVGRFNREIELTLIGRRASPTVPAPSVLEKHRWIPSLPHAEILNEMARNDLLVLPSLHEGFGLVLTEAMSQGLVVITTPHTAGPDLITHGVDGLLIPIRSADAIEEALAHLLRNRDHLAAMQEAARRRVHDYSWTNYRLALAQLARDVMGKGVEQ